MKGSGSEPGSERTGRLIVLGGTGTSIGKTHFAEALLRAGRPIARVLGLKPVESGVGEPSAATDAGRLASASSFHVKPCAYALRAPLSPHLAARDEGIELRREVIEELVRGARARADAVVVELAGGLFSPLADGMCNADLAAALMPDALLLVAPDRLGVLHDVIAAVRAASTVPLRVDGIVLVACESPDASAGRNGDELARITGVRVLAVLPRASPAELAELRCMKEILASVGIPYM